MTTYIIINTIILFGLILTIFYLIYLMIKTRENKKWEIETLNDNLNRITQIDWKAKSLLVLAFILVILAFFAPFILTRPAVNNDFDFSTTGQIGDTIGGLMNPLIAISGVFVTGLAFYIQYKANLLQRELFLKEQEENKRQLQDQIDNQNRQIRIQKFESQFYEMLKLHRENVTEMTITGYDFEESKTLKRFEKVTDGRKVFVTMKTEFECVLSLFSKDRKLNKEGFQKCYKLFFSGLDEFEKSYPDERVLIELFKKARNRHENPDEEIKTNQENF